MGTIQGDRLAVLFTDVVGSTELLSREGDRAAGEILAVHEAIVRARIREAGGRDVALGGDGFLATFPEPGAALGSAVEIQRALEAHNRARPARRVHVRIGLHYGEVVERGGQLYGQAVHAAARVMGEAAGGEILASPAVEAACNGAAGAPLLDRGLFWLKGFPDRWRLYEVVWRAADDLPHPDADPDRTRAPLVGRDAERADLRRAVRSALGGRGELVFVTGEAGVGKTRLLQEIADEAETRGMKVLVGNCIEMEGGTPYLPFVEILEHALLAPGSPIAFREALGDSASEIARLVPGLRRIVPDLPASVELPPEQAPRYLWTSVEEFLRRAAQHRPLLLLLEDLHWADESSLRLAEHLVPAVAGMPVLVVGTYRNTEVGLARPLARTVAQLIRRRMARRISLRRLEQDAVAAMIEGLAGQKPPSALVHAIHAGTEGNPFFVEEVFLHLSELGVLLDEQGRFRTDLEIGEFDVPESVRLVVGERLARMSPETRRGLTAAAVSGRAFEPAVVGLAAGLEPDALAAAFDEAESARLIVSGGSGGTASSFAHELIRQTLLQDISSVTRRQLHQRTADAIERVHGADIESHAADLAHHLSRSGPGGDSRRLVAALRMAGDRAVRAAAFDDALVHYEHAAGLLPAVDEAARAELLERLAIARRSVGRWEDAFATMDEALDLCERLGRKDAVGRLCWSMAYHLAWAARFEEAVGVAGRGLEVLGDLPNPDRARLLSVTGWAVGLAGDHGAAAELFRSAEELAERIGDRRALADVLHMKTANHMGYVEFAQGIACGLRAAAVFEEEGALWDLCGVLAFVGFQQGTTLRLTDAVATAAKVAPLAGRLGHLGAHFLVLADRIRRDGVMAGDLALTEELAREEIEVCRRGRLPWVYTAHLYLGFVAQWTGRWGDAERELRLAAELEPPGVFGGQSATHLAVLLAVTGRGEALPALVEELRPRLPVAGRVNSLGAWNSLFGLAEALYLAGRKEEAAAFLPLIREAVELGEWVTFPCRLVRTRAGIAAAAAGLWDEAEAHFAEALETAGRIGHRIEEADIRRLRAAMLADRGRPEDAHRAGELLRQAGASYREMGLSWQEADTVLPPVTPA